MNFHVEPIYTNLLMGLVKSVNVTNVKNSLMLVFPANYLNFTFITFLAFPLAQMAHTHLHFQIQSSVPNVQTTAFFALQTAPAKNVPKTFRYKMGIV